MQHVVLRLGARQLVTGVLNLIGGALDRGVVLLELQFELRDLEHRHHLAGLHARAIVDVQHLHIT